MLFAISFGRFIRVANKNDNKNFASVANFKLVTPTAYLAEILLLLFYVIS